MQVKKFDSRESLDMACAEFMISRLQGSHNRLLCPATGNSPTGTYQQFAARRDEIDTAGLHIIKLDEWCGVPMRREGTCEHYLRQYLLEPLQIPVNQYIAFDSNATQPEQECRRIAQYVDTQGPIDLCILGLGLNGHLAFNDPAEVLQPHVHLARLSESSLAHPMMQQISSPVTHGYTLGMTDILQSKTILLIVNGRHKADILQQLLKEEITTRLPASLLWLHADAYCYYSED